MCMIRNCYKTLIFGAYSSFLLLSTAHTTAHAQEEIVKEREWPRTFAGQPDFEFSRDQIATEFRKKKGREAGKYIATLHNLLEERDITPFDPTPITSDIGRSKYSKESFEAWVARDNQPFREMYPDIEIGTGVNVRLINGNTVQAQLIDDNHVSLLETGRSVRIEVTQSGDIVEYIERQNINAEFDLLFNTASNDPSNTEGELEGLPQFDFTHIDLPKIELSEADKSQFRDFKSFLENVLTQSLLEDSSNVKNRDFSPEIQNITIQSIVTSPMKYTIINHHRYNEGDRFIMRVERKEEDYKYLHALIDGYMPSQESLGEELYSQYVKVREEALKQFKEKQVVTDADGNLLKKTEDISVIIKNIEKRKVTLSIFDQDYTVKIRVSL